MKNFLKILLGLIPLIIGSASYAQNAATARVVTLEEIIFSIDQNPALLAYDDKIKSYGAYSKSARSWEAPQVSGGFWMTPYNMKENPNMGMLMIGAQQMIPNPGKQRAEENFMYGMSSVDAAMKSFEKQDLVEQAKKVYYEWLIVKKKQKVLKESEDLIQLMIKSSEIGYTYNQNLLNRIYKAKSELFNLQNMEIVNENDIKQKNIVLNTIMSISKDMTYDIDTNYTVANYDLMSVDTITLQQNRSDIKNIDESIKLYTLKRTVELSKKKPDFGVQYAHMNGLGMMPNQFTLMGMVTIPIVPWATRGYKANMEGIKYETQALNRRKEAIINNALGNLRKIKTEISNKKRQLLMYEKNIIPALEKNFSASLVSFEHMKEDMFMTIDAWVALKMAKLEYLDILGDLLKMQAEYERQIEKQ